MYNYSKGLRFMDYTNIFKNAIDNKDDYEFHRIRKVINSHKDFHCGDWDDWADNDWYLLCPNNPVSYDNCFGFLCKEFPVAVLTEYCPKQLLYILEENGIFHSDLVEPMSCDTHILQHYVRHKKVFDENFIDSCDYSFDDERFLLVLYRLETGNKQYIDSSCFTMAEIR